MQAEIAATEARRQMAHRIHTETEGMLCDDCTAFATFAVVTSPDTDTYPEHVVCDAHHDEGGIGYHIDIQPLSADVRAIHAMLGR